MSSIVTLHGSVPGYVELRVCTPHGLSCISYEPRSALSLDLLDSRAVHCRTRHRRGFCQRGDSRKITLALVSDPRLVDIGARRTSRTLLFRYTRSWQLLCRVVTTAGSWELLLYRLLLTTSTRFDAVHCAV